MVGLCCNSVVFVGWVDFFAQVVFIDCVFDIPDLFDYYSCRLFVAIVCYVLFCLTDFGVCLEACELALVWLCYFDFGVGCLFAWFCNRN